MNTPEKVRAKFAVFLGDTHCGSSVALSKRHQLDDGGWYEPSTLQKKLYTLWENFWDWSYGVIKKEPFVLVHMGDVVDGVHHRTTTLSSHNLTTQSRLAIDILSPHIGNAIKYIQIRGTEAHVGSSAQEEEAIAKILGADLNEESGTYSRWEAWLKFGDGLVHAAHHLGHTSSSSYESSALMREVVAAFAESGQWGLRAPGAVIRAHTHRYLKIEGPRDWMGIKLPAWQARTPFTYKIDRLRGPMFGGVILEAKDGRLESHKWVETIKQTAAIVI